MFATWLHICAFPGCIETALSHWKSGCFASWAQLHKLPEPAHQPTSKQPDVGFTLKKKKPWIFSHFPWPFEWLTWLGSKKIWLPYNNILGMQDGNRQPDRQKKRAQLLISTFAPGTEATWGSCLCVRPRPQLNRRRWFSELHKNKQNQSSLPLLFDYLVNQTAAASIAEHHMPSTVSVYSAPSEPQAAVNASATFCNPQKCFYCWIMHKHYCLAWENHELWLCFSNLNGLNIKI